MKFLYPQFLYALALVAIPIIIHLFNFRKFRTVYFSNVQFLKSVKEKTKSQSKLKHLLILFSRILAITALVLAFSQPYIPVDKSSQKAKKYAVSIYIDNSFSMNAENEKGRLLLNAKQHAQAIVDAYSNSDEFYILYNDFTGIQQRALNKEQFTKALNAIESSARSPSLNQIYKRQKNILEKNLSDKKDIYIISDFQKTISNLDINSKDSIYSVRLVALKPYTNSNLYVDSCWLNTPNPQLDQNIKLYARVKNNNSVKKRDVNIILEVDGKQRAISSREVTNEDIFELNFTVNSLGWHKGKLSLQDYPISFDDEFYFSFEVKPQLNIQHIYDYKYQTSLEKLFDKDSNFNYSKQNIKQINYNSLNQSQLIILDGLKDMSSGFQQSIKNAIDKGSSLLVFPNNDINKVTYKNFCQLLNIDYYEKLNDQEIKIQSLEVKHLLFDGVFETIDERLNFPKIKQYYIIGHQSQSNGLPILKLEDNNGFLNEYQLAKGKVYLSSIGLDDSFGNFSQNALFVPILYNIASYAGGKQNLFYYIGQENIPISTRTFESPMRLLNNKVEIIPEVSTSGLWLANQISEANHYELKDNKRVTKAFLSFNYNRTESDLSLFDEENLRSLSEQQSNVFLLETKLDNLSNYIQDLNTGIHLWISCILLTLLFLLIETFLIRLL
ncbi:MAG: hypothetical protein CMP55_05670 [Flavobacteriales bacterium]|nr:hypothetical protein [Flavobacteriales bacterium]